MATRFLHQGLDLEAQPYGDKAPFAVERDYVLRIDRGAAGKGSASAARGKEFVFVVRDPVLLTGDQTAVAADAGTLFVANTNVTVTLTLPLAATVKAGALFGLSVGVLTSSGGHKITPNAADTIVFTSAAAGSSMQCTAATDVLGDNLWLVSDGGTKWYIFGKVGTWAAV